MSCNNVQILNFNHNIVEVGSDNKLIITDNVKCNSITIPQPVTNILQINSPGPQGPAGLNADTGSFVTTGSFNSFTSSFNNFTSSYNTGSFTGSFTGSLEGTASWAVSASQAISSSYASFSTSASYASASTSASYALSASYAATASNILGGKATHIPFFNTDTTLATSSIYQSGSTSIIINQDNATTDAPEALYVWQPSNTSFNVISGKGTLNNYLQLNINNINPGTNASSDVVATSNNGDENGGYIDMGINSDNFSGPIGGPLDAYLYATGSHLHIGNITPNMSIQFFVGGSDTDTDRKFELNANNSHNMTGSLDISGSLNVVNTLTSSGLLTNGNNDILGNTTMSGSSTIQGTTTMTGSLNITGSTTQIGNNTLLGNTLLSGSIIISGSSTPGSPTASVRVYGDIETTGYHRFDPVTTNIDTSISASYIYVSGSTNDLYFSQNGSGYNNVTRLRWLEGNLYTGLLHGGLITATVGGTTFNLSSGSGIIVNLNASLTEDPYPTVRFINWDNFTNQTINNRTTAIQTYIGIDSNGQIIQQTNPWDNGQYNESISIGTVIHQNLSTVNATITYPNVAYGYKQRTYDFIKAFGPLKLSGYDLSTSSSLGLTVGSGSAFADGRNYEINPNNPSYILDNGTAVSKIFRYYQSGSSFVQDTNAGAGYTGIDTTRYNLNGSGSLVSTSGGKYYAQRVFWYPNSATKGIVVYYGLTEYNSLDEAQADYLQENFLETPNTQQNAIYLGVILIRGNGSFTNASDYRILKSSLFRAAGVGGGGGTGGGGATTLGDLTDVQLGTELNKQSLVYDSVLFKWVNTYSLSGSLTGSLFGTASWAEYVVNSGGNAFPYNGAAVITGSLLVSGSGVTITGSLSVSNGFTGSLQGTASYISGSVFDSSNPALSASYATTAQNVLGSVTTAQTASYATNFTVATSLTIDGAQMRGATVNSTDVGSNTLFDQATGSYTSAHGRYTLHNGSNARAGEFVTVWNGTTTTYYDNATTDIGSTSDITFQSSIVSSQIRIDAVAASSGWTVKMLVTYL